MKKEEIKETLNESEVEIRFNGGKKITLKNSDYLLNKDYKFGYNYIKKYYPNVTIECIPDNIEIINRLKNKYYEYESNS